MKKLYNMLKKHHQILIVITYVIVMETLSYSTLNSETSYVSKDFKGYIFYLTGFLNFTLLIYAFYKIYIKDKLAEKINKKNA